MPKARHPIGAIASFARRDGAGDVGELIRRTGMGWVGRWKNQYGSVLNVTEDADGRIAGTFKTALLESGFYGTEIAVCGTHLGHCISFAFTASTVGGDLLCSYSGLLRGDRLNTVWHVISDGQLDPEARITERAWPHAVTTNAETFLREP